MVLYKISKLLNDSTVSKFEAKKWIEVNDLSSGQYSVDTFVANAEDLDITVMSMYNLLEYSNNYSMASGSLWNYYRDEVNDDGNEIDNNKNRILI